MELAALPLTPEQNENSVYERLLKRNVYKSSEQKNLRISIITVSYNSERTIRHTLESVRNQSYSHIEHIIVDGGSTDGTMDIVRSFPHVLKFVSEKDKGIYDAMNKGIQMATGDVIGILNSDDFYSHSEVIAKVAKQFEASGADTVYGDLHYIDQNNRVLRKWTSGKYNTLNFKFGWMPPHPTFFVKNDVYKQVGAFNLNLRTAADYEMMLRILFKHRFGAAYLPEVLVKMRTGGVSNGSIKGRIRANHEDRLAWKINNLQPYFFTLYMKPLRKITQFMHKEQMKRLPLISNFL